jgi:pyruvate/2-oxoglutarate dehydrogenase complex dihydrolipoamide acyltransferase (E2) component
LSPGPNAPAPNGPPFVLPPRRPPLPQVGAPLLDILVTDGSADDEAAAGAPQHAPPPPEPAPSFGAPRGAVLASPAVRNLARELGVDLGAVSGTGPGGRILKDDVLDASEAAAAAGPAAAAAAAAAAGLLGDAAAVAAGGLGDGALALGRAAAATAMAEAEDAAPPAAPGAPQQAGVGFAAVTTAPMAAAAASTRLPLRGYRRAMVKSSVEAAAVPTFHYMDDLEVDELLKVKGQLAADSARLAGGARLTYLPFIVKALSVALGRFPELNSQLAPGGAELIQLGSHNIGVAMATGGGLVVPNIKGVRAAAGVGGGAVVGRGGGPQRLPA